MTICVTACEGFLGSSRLGGAPARCRQAPLPPRHLVFPCSRSTPGADLPPQLPGDPQQQDAARQQQTDRSSSCAVNIAKTMRISAAAMMPMRIACRRCAAGSPAAAMPTTMALSPASAMSMRITETRAVSASGSRGVRHVLRIRLGERPATNQRPRNSEPSKPRTICRPSVEPMLRAALLATRSSAKLAGALRALRPGPDDAARRPPRHLRLARVPSIS